MIGAMIAGPLMHNARKKRNIIEKHMSLKGATPETRKKDIYAPAMISGVLGGATAGASLGAEALAAEKVTKLIGHVVIDGALAKAEDKHAAKEHAKEVSRYEAGQLIRSSSMPAVVPAMGSTGRENMVGTLLKHANTLPGPLGTSANGLIASASRLRAEKYPLLREYITSVASQSKRYMSFSKPGGNGLSPAGRNWTEPATKSEVDSDPLPENNTSYADTQSSSSTQASATQTFVAELEGDSYYSASLVSPIGSSIAEMDGDLDRWPVSPCETTYAPSEVEGDYAFDNLIKAMDETALSEIEYELELAIQEMDDPTATHQGAPDKQSSTAFHSPADVDTIVRRQSVRYSKRCSVRDSQYSFDDTRSTINQASVAPLRSPRSFSGGLHLVEVHGQKDSKSSTLGDLMEGNSEPPSPTDTVLPAYAETDPSIAPEVCFTDASSSTVLSSKSSAYYASSEKECVAPVHPLRMRGGGLSHSESTSSSVASSSRLIMSDPNSPELVVRDTPTEDFTTETMSNASWMASSQTPELVRPPSPAQSEMGKRAMSAHNGMKKIGYFGLEPAAKLAIGGSLLLMGVRPSVQRKMLDKAKSKIGMSDNDRRKDEDDDYRDYI